MTARLFFLISVYIIKVKGMGMAKCLFVKKKLMDVVYCFFMITIFAEVNAFYGQKGKKTCSIANKKLYVTLKKEGQA